MAYVMNKDRVANNKTGQFYPVIIPGRHTPFTGAQGAGFARNLGTQLVGAPVYQVTGEMCASTGSPASPLPPAVSTG